jgi:hypothetical protein
LDLHGLLYPLNLVKPGGLDRANGGNSTSPSI